MQIRGYSRPELVEAEDAGGTGSSTLHGLPASAALMQDLDVDLDQLGDLPAHMLRRSMQEVRMALAQDMRRQLVAAAQAAEEGPSHQAAPPLHRTSGRASLAVSEQASRGGQGQRSKRSGQRLSWQEAGFPLLIFKGGG
jgi:hypothetical protein